LILLTGATGYVGGRLLQELEARAAHVRCLVRDPALLTESSSGSAEFVQGDLLDASTLDSALEGVESAFYLVRTTRVDYEELERRAARNFAEAARRKGLRRIVHLGRAEVGEILRSTGVPVLELRPSIVLGSGSLPFETVRALVERLPFMLTPTWVDAELQPLAERDLILYLLEALDVPLEESRTVQLGGAERGSIRDLMREYGRQRGYPRRMLALPIATRALSSLFLGFVTPFRVRDARRMIDRILRTAAARDTDGADKLFSVRPVGIRRAIEDVLAREEREPLDAEAHAVPAPRRPPITGVRIGNHLVDSRSMHVDACPEEAFAPIMRIGGATGWYSCDGLWKLRGKMDVLIGGKGLSSGRADAEVLRVGDALDWWRVEAIEEGRLLLLTGELKLPGRGWLQFEVVSEGDGARVRQTAVFDPHGLAGLAYWYLICPLHALIFGRMLAGIVAAAERADGACEAV